MKIKQLKNGNPWLTTKIVFKQPETQKIMLIWLSIVIFADLMMMASKYYDLRSLPAMFGSLNDFRFIMPNVIGILFIPFGVLLSVIMLKLKANSIVEFGSDSITLSRYGLLGLFRNIEFRYADITSIATIKKRFIRILYKGSLIEKQLALIGYDDSDIEIVELLKNKTGLKVYKMNASGAVLDDGS